MIAFIFPGQGSQKVGMGKALAEAFPEARATFDEADAAFGVWEQPSMWGPRSDGHGPAQAGTHTSLSSLCFDGPECALALTEVTQPALLAASIAACRVLTGRGVAPAFVAGHSLGEYSANVAAGTLGFAAAIAIVRRRGRYMQEAVPVGDGAMAAILGGGADVVARACAAAAQGEIVAPANFNSPGQIVIAGAAGAVRRASELARAYGAKRAIPLAVSAPFHCAMMKPAEARLAPELLALPTGEPLMPVIANVDAEPKRDARAAMDALVRQVSAPVQWESVVRRLASEGVTTYVEVGPGAVLSGLVRKIDAGARVLQFGSPADLEAVMTACST